MIVHFPMAEAERFLEGVTDSLRGQALRNGMFAYLRAVRREAEGSGPYRVFQSEKGYRFGVGKRVQPSRGITAFLYSGAGFGNVIEAGYAGHIARGDDTVLPNGNVMPGIGTWLRKHNLTAAVGFGAKSKALKVKTQPGRPWVIPAYERSKEEASAAFLDAVVTTISKGL